MIILVSIICYCQNLGDDGTVTHWLLWCLYDCICLPKLTGFYTIKGKFTIYNYNSIKKISTRAILRSTITIFQLFCKNVSMYNPSFSELHRPVGLMTSHCQWWFTLHWLSPCLATQPPAKSQGPLKNTVSLRHFVPSKVWKHRHSRVARFSK